MPSGVRVRLPPWAPHQFFGKASAASTTLKVLFISPDDISLGTLDVPKSDRLCLVAIRVKNYTRLLSDTERSYVQSVSKARREQYSSGRRAAQLGLNALNISEVPILIDDRRPDWPSHVIGSIAHSDELAVALVGFKQDFRGVGIDILPKYSVSERVRNRVLRDSELEIVSSEESRDLQTVYFCAKESIYKATNPESNEFLGFRDVCVQVDALTTEFTAKTVSEKLSSELVACGRGYVFSADDHWLTMYLVT